MTSSISLLKEQSYVPSKDPWVLFLRLGPKLCQIFVVGVPDPYFPQKVNTRHGKQRENQYDRGEQRRTQSKGEGRETVG